MNHPVFAAMTMNPSRRALRRFRHSLDWLQGAAIVALLFYLGALAFLQ